MGYVTPGKLKVFKQLQDSYNEEKFIKKEEIIEAGKVKTVNNIEPDENGNIELPVPNLSSKQDVISDLETIRNNASAGANLVSTVNAIPDTYATKEDISSKQDTITDLETIRNGAALGATALQSYTEKYTGTYSKPSTGIPKTDLASAVQTSLGKADTAIQTETDPVFSASAAAGIKSTDITNWNSKTSNVGTVTSVNNVAPVNGNVTLSIPSAYTHPSHTTATSGLYKITVDSLGHVSATTAVTKADITGLGIPGSDTNTDTKVTSVDNHYAPAENTASAISASGGTLTDIANSSTGTQVVTGLKRDAKGHVVGVTSVALKATNTANTDTKVTSVSNHYTPAENTDSAISASGGTLTDITNSSTGTQVVTGLKRDAAGHVVGVTSVALKSTNTNTTYSAAANGGLTLSGTAFSADGNKIINNLSEGSSNATRNDYIVAQYADGGTTTTTYHRRKLSNIFAALNKSDITTALGYTPPTTDTNTDTKVTSVGNHYTPAENTASAISASGGTLTDITNSSTGTQVVTGLKRDAAGHVVGVTSIALKSTNSNTTYSAGTGISLSGTTFSNSGVRSVSQGSANGTISVNTNGTAADVAVKGLGSAAYTASTAYAPASHGNHVPATETANNAKFLRNDNTWQLVTPANIGAATSGHNHDSVYSKTDNKVAQTAVTHTDYTNYRSLVWSTCNSGTKGFNPSSATDVTYVSKNLYVQPSSGTIFATQYQVAEKVTLQWNSTTESLDFVFA